jgi:transposase
MIVAERRARIEAEAKADAAEAKAATAQAEAANVQADLSSHEALVAHLKLEIEKLRRELYGQRSERKARLLEQMELQLEELEAAATEDELAAERAAANITTVRSFKRKRPVRKPWPDNIPRERVVILFNIERDISDRCCRRAAAHSPGTEQAAPERTGKLAARAA